jgi:UDP-N-acetylmuramate dehydrogenase
MLHIQHNIDLVCYNTFGFHSVAEFFVRITKPIEVPKLCEYCRREKLPLLLIGGGSNLVLGDFVPGVVAKMEIMGYTTENTGAEHVNVIAGAGESWHEMVERTLNNNQYGLENLALIPGTVGASPVQNIGAYGVELKDFVNIVEVYDRKEDSFDKLTKEACAFAYRDSVFKSGDPERYIITAVHFNLNKEPKLHLDYSSLRSTCQKLAGAEVITPRHVFDAVCQLRSSKLPDPSEIGSAGSFFKNPVVSEAYYRRLLSQYPSLVAFPDGQGYKLAAGWLIDQCGWKGKTLGQVGVYDKQALVLVNKGGGNREQIEQLATAIQDSVKSRFDVLLEPEPRFYP